MRDAGEFRWPVALAFLGFLVCFAGGCGKREPVKVGFVGPISGRVADLGVNGRDGALLAIEQKNLSGGIKGRELELIVKDDLMSKDVVRKVSQELVEQGVVGIVGPLASSMAVTAVEIANEHKVLMLSPTASSDVLSGKDDYFFRIYPSSAETSKLLARQVINVMGHKSTFVVYDVTNRDHTESAFEHYAKEYKSLGGKISGKKTFFSGPETKFSEIASEVLEAKPDCLYLLANAIDSAMLAQQLHKAGAKIQIVTSEWSATEDFLQFGGSAVEGIFFYRLYDHYCDDQKYQDFISAFKERFGRSPDFSSLYCYDSTMILVEALERTSGAMKLKDAVLEIGTFQGVQAEISFDKYGDVIREHFPFTIRDGRFVTAEQGE